MVFVLYQNEQLVGFSESRPSQGRYFEIDDRGIKKVKRAVAQGNWSYLLIRRHKPESLSYSIDLSEENCVAVSPEVINLIANATRNLKEANQDLETILKGIEVQKKYQQR